MLREGDSCFPEEEHVGIRREVERERECSVENAEGEEKRSGRKRGHDCEKEGDSKEVDIGMEYVDMILVENN